MTQRTRTPSTATRTIRFYYLHGGREIERGHQQVDLAPLLNTAEQLPPTVPPSPGSRYMAGRTTRSFTTTDNPTNPVHFRFITTRVDNYPDDEVAATTVPLVLAQDHGLADTWHCVFSPPYTLAIAAQDTTATAKRLEKYLREKNPAQSSVCIEPIASGDVIDQVMNMNPLSRVTISLRPQDVQAYVNGLDTNKAIAAIAEDCEILTELLVTYNPSPTGLGQFKARILEPLVAFVSRISTPKPKRLTVKGQTDPASKSFAVDLLLDVSSVQKEIRKKPSPSGALDDNDAYTQIEAAIIETFQYLDPERRDSKWFVVQTPATGTQSYQPPLLDF